MRRNTLVLLRNVFTVLDSPFGFTYSFLSWLVNYWRLITDQKFRSFDRWIARETTERPPLSKQPRVKRENLLLNHRFQNLYTQTLTHFGCEILDLCLKGCDLSLKLRGRPLSGLRQTTLTVLSLLTKYFLFIYFLFYDSRKNQMSTILLSKSFVSRTPLYRSSLVKYDSICFRRF